jgi:hypothetical protein
MDEDTQIGLVVERAVDDMGGLARGRDRDRLIGVAGRFVKNCTLSRQREERAFSPEPSESTGVPPRLDQKRRLV